MVSHCTKQCRPTPTPRPSFTPSPVPLSPGLSSPEWGLQTCTEARRGLSASESPRTATFHPQVRGPAPSPSPVGAAHSTAHGTQSHAWGTLRPAWMSPTSAPHVRSQKRPLCQRAGQGRPYTETNKSIIRGEASMALSVSRPVSTRTTHQVSGRSCYGIQMATAHERQVLPDSSAHVWSAFFLREAGVVPDGVPSPLPWVRPPPSPAQASHPSMHTAPLGPLVGRSWACPSPSAGTGASPEL